MRVRRGMGVESPNRRRCTAVAGRIALSPDTLWSLVAQCGKYDAGILAC
jgi:hypothetical protein